jgi:hypothetical protein
VQNPKADKIRESSTAASAPPAVLHAFLTAATHAHDMSVQNRPWHFGSGGSSPIDRAKRAGYTGTVLGKNIAET